MGRQVWCNPVGCVVMVDRETSVWTHWTVQLNGVSQTRGTHMYRRHIYIHLPTIVSIILTNSCTENKHESTSTTFSGGRLEYSP